MLKKSLNQNSLTDRNQDKKWYGIGVCGGELKFSIISMFLYTHYKKYKLTQKIKKILGVADFHHLVSIKVCLNLSWIYIRVLIFTKNMVYKYMEHTHTFTSSFIYICTC